MQFRENITGKKRPSLSILFTFYMHQYTYKLLVRKTSKNEQKTAILQVNIGDKDYTGRWAKELTLLFSVS